MRTTISMSTITPTKPSLESISPTPATAAQQQRTPWHSPVPYLFGGLAAMLGLIAFALLILACSYWKHSGRLEDRERGERDLESGGGDEKDQSNKPVKVFEEKILVIMAGNENPTYLATPVSVCSKVACFGEKVDVGEMEKEGEKEESSEKVKEEFGGGNEEDGEAVSSNQNRETLERQLEEEKGEEEEGQHQSQ